MSNALLFNRSIFSSCILITALFNLPLKANAQQGFETNRGNTYKAAIFTDTNRLKKITAALPVIEKLYKEHAEKNYIPGFTFGVVVDGKLIYSGNAGYANITGKIPVTNQSAFRIASMTKSFTAMAILQLRDEGKLALDDRADVYIPEFKKQQLLTADAPPITIRNLLTHSAGFPEDNPWGDRQLANTDEELLALIEKGISFSNVPGIAYEYSNLAFAMLGQTITKVSGIPYQQYISENILKPLGMNNTYWEYTKVPAKQLVHGYRWVNGNWQEEPLLHDGSFGAMGGLITSAEDFARYMNLHLAAWPPRDEDDKKILRHSSIREMHQPWTFNTLNTSYKFLSGRPCATASAYGYGLRWIKDCDGRTFVGHAGGLPGFGSNWLIMPEYGIGVLFFGNVTYAPATAINLQVLDTLIKLAQLKPRQLSPSFILEQRKTELVNLLPHWKDARNTNIFAQNFFSDYSLDLLAKNAQTLFAKAGKIIKVSPVLPENNLRGYFLLQGEKADLKVSFTLTPQTPALIQAFELTEVSRD